MDHQTTGRRTLDTAWPACRDYLNFPDLYDSGILPWIVPEVWLFSFSKKTENNEILLKLTTSMFNYKYNALLYHESQFSTADEVRQGIIFVFLRLFFQIEMKRYIVLH